MYRTNASTPDDPSRSNPTATEVRAAGRSSFSQTALRAALALLAVLAVAVPGRSGTLDPAQIKEFNFKNGLKLVVKEAHATELASVQVWIRAGGFLENETSAGTAHVIEHMVFKGSETGGPGTIDGEIENLGGLLEASTEKDYTRFACTVSGRYVNKVVGVIADALRKPEFRPQDFESEKPILLEEINTIRTSPERMIASVLYELAYQKHPYRFDVRGTPRFINQLDLTSVKAFYQKHYVPANMTVVVVGDVDTAGVEKAVRTAFQADQPAPAAAAAPLPPDEVACATPQRRVLNSPFTNGYVGLAFPAPSVKDIPDVYAMDVLLTLLEHAGSGRLPRLLKDAAGVSTVFETRRQKGLFLITALTGAGVEQVEALIRKELDTLRTSLVPAAELSLAKRELRGSYALDNEPYTGQAGTLGYYAAIDSWKFAGDYLQRIEAVTAEQVRDIARRYLDNDHSAAILLRPRGGNGVPMRPGSSASTSGSPRGTWRTARPSRPELRVASSEIQAPGHRRPVSSSQPAVRQSPLGSALPSALVALQAPTATAPAPPRKRVTTAASSLSNGLRLLCRPNTSTEIVSIVCQVRAGLPDERDDQAGIAALTAEALVRGSTTYPGDSFGNAMLRAGGLLRSQAGFDFAEISIVTGREQFEPALKLIADVLAHPRFAPEAIADAKQILKRRAANLRDDFTGASYQGLLSQLYRGTPYGRSMTGYNETLDRLTADDVRKFWQANYVQNRMVVGIVGDVDPDRTLTLAQKAFREVPYKPGAATTGNTSRATLDRPRVEVIQRSGPFAQVMAGFLTPAATRESYALYAVLDALVGGGKRARLFRNIREKAELGYELGSFYQPLLQQSHLVGYAVVPEFRTDPKTEQPKLTYEAAKNLLLTQYRDLITTPPTDAEVARAKSYVIGRYALRQERTRDQAKWLSWNEAMGFGRDFDEAFPTLVSAVTKEQLQEVARRVLNNYALVVTIPTQN